MKYCLIALLVIMFSGCGAFNKIGAHLGEYTEVCVDEVVYLQFPSGATVKYNKDGSIKTCDKKLYY